MSKVAVVVSALLALAQVQAGLTPQAEADLITSLPGTGKISIPFRQFSGYLDIPGTAGKQHMHYWFVESQGKPASDPLTFWTNGGPGCSGLIGFMTEHGPFIPNADNSLSLNEYAWNKLSNMVYIESPAGVGFSYPDSKDDLKASDASTAQDNYNLIQAFLERFPDLRSNALYITSESYGGHYMPTLAKKIVDENKAGNSSHPKLNFKGFAVGNPYTSPYSGTPAGIDTYYGHQLISAPLYADYQKNCGVDGSKTSSLSCETSMLKAMNAIGNLNPYALDYPVCTADGKRQVSAQALWQQAHQLRELGLDPRRLGLKSVQDYEPCGDDYAAAYLNLPAVKAALHVKTDIAWEMCSNAVKYNTNDRSQASTAPIYNELVSSGAGLQILVYSGDDDSVCGTVGTQSWIWGLGYQPAVNWQVDMLNGQTVGYLTKFKGAHLSFLTVHGAGHEVPTYKPEVALNMFKRYLAGELTDK